jgi:hypothetical protein
VWRASAEMDVRFGAPSVVAAKDQHVVNTGCAQLAEGEFLRAGGHGGMSRPAAIRRLVEIGLETAKIMGLETAKGRRSGPG